jgi:hypothetical protein
MTRSGRSEGHNARLRQVRQALLQADPEASVTGIATNAGFTHLGRFLIVHPQALW